jgi:hypothetical protein
MKKTTVKKESGAKAEKPAKTHPWMNGGLGDWRSGAPQRPDELSPDVLEFIGALDAYRDKYSRPFPTWSEVFGVLMSLGYRKVAKPAP